MFAVLIALATCLSVWLLTGRQPNRALGALLGLLASALWLIAGAVAGKTAVVLIALFCALCFARPLLRGRSVSFFGKRGGDAA